MTSGIITAFAMIAFLAIAVWVFLIKRKEDFDEQAHLPLEDDKPLDGNQYTEEKSS